MIRQTELGETEKEQKKKIRQLIKKGFITFAGNRNLKIYGRLDCGSGKRTKRENRVFFNNKAGAIQHGYRPCGNCMSKEYGRWKNKISQ